VRRKGKRVSLIVSFTSDERWAARAMSEEAELASPAAAIVARRESRMPERLKVSAPDDSPDDDWDPEEGAGATDEEDSDAEDSAGADGTDFIRIATPLRAAGGCGRLG
jgi:hypothetical protein